MCASVPCALALSCWRTAAAVGVAVGRAADLVVLAKGLLEASLQGLRAGPVPAPCVCHEDEHALRVVWQLRLACTGLTVRPMTRLAGATSCSKLDFGAHASAMRTATTPSWAPRASPGSCTVHHAGPYNPSWLCKHRESRKLGTPLRLGPIYPRGCVWAVRLCHLCSAPGSWTRSAAAPGPAALRMAQISHCCCTLPSFVPRPSAEVVRKKA